MVGRVSCAVAVVFAIVVAAPSTKVRPRRSYSDVGYVLDTIEDASIAGDHGAIDCIDDDSESIELAYIINKREALMASKSRIASIPPASATATNYPK